MRNIAFYFCLMSCMIGYQTIAKSTTNPDQERLAEIQCNLMPERCGVPVSEPAQ